MMKTENQSWSQEQLALLLRHTNEQIAELTGRSIEDIRERRLLANIERNCWDVYQPERAACD
nr:hypothetical protein [uncultured Enterobacter sp.]